MKNIKKYEDFISEEVNLKKALAGAALGAGLAFSNPANSQITTTKVSKTEVERKEEEEYNRKVANPYDSTYNDIPKVYKYDNYGNSKWSPHVDFPEKLVGQRLYLNTKEYSDFTPGSRAWAEDFVLCDEFSNPITKIDNIYGKYFNVVEYVNKLKSTDKKDKNTYHTLKLVSDDGVTIYFNPREGKFPFIIVGYYEKVKSVCIGKYITHFLPKGLFLGTEFIQEYSTLCKMRFGHIYDVNNGNEIKPSDKSKCIDVTTTEDGEISLVFDDNGAKFLIPLKKVEPYVFTK